MAQLIMAQANGRTIGGPDKIFGVSNLAKARIAEIGKENVVNSTIGALLDDEGDLIVLSSVVDVLKNLSPVDYAEYAPIAGIPSYLEAVKSAVFGANRPEGHVEACFTPGGTGAIRNAVSCYTKPGDAVLTSDWHWSPYRTIMAEQGRTLETYTLFDENNRFNAASFDEALKSILNRQDETVVIINTPAHNPTGYTFTLSDWDQVIASLKEAAGKTKKIALLADIAYLDFSGDADEYRAFLPKLSGLPENILPLIAFSASKGFTMYGMRCGALLCLAPTPEIAAEFKAASSVASRASWSNGNRAAMETIARIFNDRELLDKVTQEREHYLDVLIRRGTAFMDAARAAGLSMCPYDSGFFVTIPCQDADAVSVELQKYDIFAVPIGGGIRIAICAISEEKCRMIPEKMVAAIEAVKQAK